MAGERNSVEYEYRESPTPPSGERLAVAETGLEPSHSEGMFTFMWRRSSAGGTSITSKVGNFLIPAGSTSTGYRGPGEPILIDPIQPEHKDGPWIADSFSLWEWYEPFSTPSLHRKFARLSGSHAAIRRFSRRYGLLGHGACLLSLLNGDMVRNRKIEAIRYWRREIATMRRLIEIWEHAAKRHVGELHSFVKWAVQTEGMDRPRNMVSWIEPHSELELFERPSAIIPFLSNELLGFEGSPVVPMPNGWKVGDILEPAKLFVSHNVNKRLAEHVSPRVMPFNKGDILLWPDCLLSAMYVQFAHEISGRVGRLIECRGCGMVIEQRPSSRRYCEPECRQRRYWRVTGYEKAKKRKADREVSNA